MSRFGMIYEDPSYDEDGVLCDEDGNICDEDWDNEQEDWHEEDEVPPVPSLNERLQVMMGTDPYSPYVTVNS